MTAWARTAWEAILDVLYVPECGACRKTLFGTEKSVCLPCLSALEATDHARRPDDNPVYHTISSHVPVQGAAAGFVFNDTMREFIHAFKYDNRPDVARRLGRWWGERLGEQPLAANITCLVPMPLHVRKERERGYNQARELAGGLSKALNVPVVYPLARLRHTRQQALLSQAERLTNVAGAMRADATTAGVQGVAVIDDVVTTGATMAAAVKALYAAGTPPVYVLALATAG